MARGVRFATSLDKVDPAWAWQPFEPSRELPWDLARAAHLYRRAAFGASWGQLQQAVREGPARTIDRLMGEGAIKGKQADEVDAFYDRSARMAQAIASNVENLPAWWLHTMLHTPHPLLEKMTLFWHGHFATSAAKVEDAGLMLAQNNLLRKHALGRFGPLVAGMAKDPAMLLWLDSATNRKFKPNENFAREVMELFCLGLGNYTETDIKEAARAFTGWEVRHRKFVFNGNQHDDGVKRILGQDGRFGGEDVLRILLEQPATSQFIAGKVYRYLVSDTADPPAALLNPLAEFYRRNDYDAAALVRTVVSSNLFFSSHSMHQKVKAPVDLAVGLVRALEGSTNTYALARDLRTLGQGVFYPPNVKGWDGGKEWINSSTLLTRVNLVWALASGRVGDYKKKFDLAELAGRFDKSKPADAARWLSELIISAELPREVHLHLTNVAAAADDNPHIRLARVVQAIAALPEFHLM